MGRCYSDCTSPDWHRFGVARRWSVVGSWLVAVVHQWWQCRRCAALHTVSDEVERYPLGNEPAQLELVA